MNNDELQKAIDDITKDNAPAETAPVADAAPAAGNDQLVNEIVDHVAAPIDDKPVAPSVPEVDLGAAPAPAVPTEPAMPPMPPMPETAEPVAPAPVVSETPADNNATLEEAMKELYPLLDKVEMPVEEKFDITIKYGEPAKALDLAKQITDETAKANALLEIINKVK